MNPIDLAYRDALGSITGATLARIAAGWVRLYDPARPLYTSARIAELAEAWIAGAQLAAADLAALYLAALTAQAAGVALADVTPYRVPPGLVGTAYRGGPLAELTRLTPSILWARLKAGQDPDLAAQAAAGWLGRIGASEPYRVANETVDRNAVDDDRLTGRVERITSPGACAFCVMIRDRGYIPANAGFAAHTHCRCTASPEISSHAYSRSARWRAARALERTQ